VGSSNLNIASWMGNLELDVVVQDAGFAQAMEQAYLEDLENSTELVLRSRRQRVAVPGLKDRRRRNAFRSRGSAGRAAAGAIRIGHTVGAAVTDRRVLAPLESRLIAGAGAALVALAAAALLWPWVVAIPVAALAAWIGAALLAQAYSLHRSRGDRTSSLPPPGS
jgi:cardiolipin synthase